MAYTDWIPTMDSIKSKKDLSIIEFGLGDGTEYLLNNFKLVYSFELADNDYWYKITKDRFGNFQNWKADFVNFTEVGFWDYMPQLPEQLISRIDDIFNDKYDVVFMDGGYHNRGQIANLILNKFSPQYLVIHDINFAFEQDMYDQIVIPQEYDFSDDNNGEGTRIYFKK